MIKFTCWRPMADATGCESIWLTSTAIRVMPNIPLLQSVHRWKNTEWCLLEHTVERPVSLSASSDCHLSATGTWNALYPGQTVTSPYHRSEEPHAFTNRLQKRTVRIRLVVLSSVVSMANMTPFFVMPACVKLLLRKTARLCETKSTSVCRHRAMHTH